MGLNFQSLEEASFDDKPENNAKNLDCPELIKAISERVAFKQVLRASGTGNIQSIEFYNQPGDATDVLRNLHSLGTAAMRPLSTGLLQQLVFRSCSFRSCVFPRPVRVVGNRATRARESRQRLKRSNPVTCSIMPSVNLSCSNLANRTNRRPANFTPSPVYNTPARNAPKDFPCSENRASTIIRNTRASNTILTHKIASIS